MATSSVLDAAQSRRNHPTARHRLPHERVGFAHNSERQFAKLLDFYAIEWDYEPITFVLERDRAGNPVHAFSPDFYLPAFDQFIEITTQRQRLVTKKNRKVRLLQERYPHVNIKVLYQRDYMALLVKYGLESPSQLAEVGLGFDAAGGVPSTPLSFLTVH